MFNSPTQSATTTTTTTATAPYLLFAIKVTFNMGAFKVRIQK